MAETNKKRQDGEMFREIGRGFMDLITEVSGKGAKERAEAAKKAQEAREAKAEKKREVRGVDSFDYLNKEMKRTGRLIDYKNPTEGDYRKGGMVKSSASKRADGCAKRGKTKGRMV